MAESLPEEMLVKIVVRFMESDSDDERAKLRAIKEFRSAIEGDYPLMDYETAWSFLDRRDLVSDYVIEMHEIIDAESVAEENKKRIEREKQQEAQYRKIEADLTGQRKALKSYFDAQIETNEALKGNTNPEATNKSSFWINMKAGAIYFVAGVLASPVSSVLFKHQQESFDKWMYPEDHQSAPPAASAAGAAVAQGEIKETKTGSKRVFVTVDGTKFTCERPAEPVTNLPNAAQQPR